VKTEMENLLNVNQVAFILKVHPLTIRRYIREGKLKALKAGGNIRITESELQAFHNREFEPKPKETPMQVFREARKPLKQFTDADPFLRLQGRGAKLHLST
jgi:excisionase family DNA binding protein